MNETDPGAEHEPELMSAVKRYYTDVYYAENDYATIVMALHSLLENLPFTTDMQINTFANSEYMTTEHELENDPRIATEKLALLPLFYFGPQLEQSSCTTDEIKDWYNDAVNGVRLLTQDDHDTICLENRSTTHHMCAKSTVCPQRFMEAFLSIDLMEPDFDWYMYDIDPERTYTIAANKLQVGVKQGILLPTEADAIEAKYVMQYRERFKG